jgi:CheY-like chemotaxis protein
VLVIEDEPEFARILFDLAHDLEYRCLVALTAGEGLELAASESPDAILLDMRLPDRLRPVGAAAAEGQPGHPPHSGARGVEHGKRRRGAAPGRDRLCAQADQREQLEEVFRKLQEKSLAEDQARAAGRGRRAPARQRGAADRRRGRRDRRGRFRRGSAGPACAPRFSTA